MTTLDTTKTATPAERYHAALREMRRARVKIRDLRARLVELQRAASELDALSNQLDALVRERRAIRAAALAEGRKASTPALDQKIAAAKAKLDAIADDADTLGDAIDEVEARVDIAKSALERAEASRDRAIGVLAQERADAILLKIFGGAPQPLPVTEGQVVEYSDDPRVSTDENRALFERHQAAVQKVRALRDQYAIAVHAAKALGADFRWSRKHDDALWDWSQRGEAAATPSESDVQRLVDALEAELSGADDDGS
jgi:DNA repair exonuclease SbcCD ATPase subunit